MRLPCLHDFDSRGGGSSPNHMTYDIAVVGGGIVGLSFAMQATQQFPHLRLRSPRALRCAVRAAGR